MAPVAASRLTRSDWLDAGQALLREHGVTAVKLRPLLARLGVTTGSFYHHFADIAEYRDALADHYGAQTLEFALASVAPLRGVARLQEMWRLAVELDIPRLDHAMRVWATSSARAAAAVRRSDEQLLEVVREAFSDLGFDERDARTRALLVFSAGAGGSLIFSPWSADEDHFARALALVTAAVR